MLSLDLGLEVLWGGFGGAEGGLAALTAFALPLDEEELLGHFLHLLPPSSSISAALGLVAFLPLAAASFLCLFTRTWRI